MARVILIRCAHSRRFVAFKYWKGHVPDSIGIPAQGKILVVSASRTAESFQDLFFRLTKYLNTFVPRTIVLSVSDDSKALQSIRQYAAASIDTLLKAYLRSCGT